ncbi:MAG: hypothetical protein HY875_06845 [Chloroflexi bacterium]|nr:hypothetical protein [Chloroflexota bacterium]
MTRVFLALIALCVALPAALVSAATPAQTAIVRGVDFIRTTQQADGGFGGFGPGQTMDAVYALRAAGIQPETVTRDGKSPADYLRANAASLDTPAAAAKGVLGAVAMGMDPRAVAGVDLVGRIRAGFTESTGRYADDDFSHAVAIFGLACTGNSVPGTALFALRAAQLDDGSWGFGGFGDPDTTAIAVEALVAAGVGPADSDVRQAIASLRATQAADGGWGFDPAASNASSTAYVIQSLIAAGEDAASATYQKPGGNPISFLLGQQQADGSFIGYDPAYSTNQALPALAGRTFCHAVTTPAAPAPPAATATPAPSPKASPTPRPPSTGSGQQDATSGSGGEAVLPAAVLGALVLRAFAASRKRKS